MRTLSELRDFFSRSDVAETVDECVSDVIAEAVAAYESRDATRRDPQRLGKMLLDAIADAHGNLDEEAEAIQPERFEEAA